MPDQATQLSADDVRQEAIAQAASDALPDLAKQRIADIADSKRAYSIYADRRRRVAEYLRDAADPDMFHEMHLKWDALPTYYSEGTFLDAGEPTYIERLNNDRVVILQHAEVRVAEGGVNVWGTNKSATLVVIVPDATGHDLAGLYDHVLAAFPSRFRSPRASLDRMEEDYRVEIDHFFHHEGPDAVQRAIDYVLSKGL